MKKKEQLLHDFQEMWVVCEIHKDGLWPRVETVAWRWYNSVRKYNEKTGRTTRGTQVFTYKQKKAKGEVICKKLTIQLAKRIRKRKVTEDDLEKIDFEG